METATTMETTKDTDGISPGTWWQRNGIPLLMGLTLLIALFSYMQYQFSDMRADIRTQFSDVRADMRDVQADIRDVRDSIDRVETKVDEVRGALKFNSGASG